MVFCCANRHYYCYRHHSVSNRYLMVVVVVVMTDAVEVMVVVYNLERYHDRCVVVFDMLVEVYSFLVVKISHPYLFAGYSVSDGLPDSMRGHYFRSAAVDPNRPDVPNENHLPYDAKYLAHLMYSDSVGHCLAYYLDLHLPVD